MREEKTAPTDGQGGSPHDALSRQRYMKINSFSIPS